jgi:uncharacterized repeat protein (TIGR01451 family)
MKARPTLLRTTQVLVILAALALGVAPALAVHEDGVFELDGNVADPNGSTPPDDWATLFTCAAGGEPGCTLSGGGNTSEPPTFLLDGEGPTVFASGESKDKLDIPNWRWKDGSTPPKDDLFEGFAAAYTDSSGNKRIYFGANRFAVNGDAQIGFWFFRNRVTLNSDGTFSGTHAVGDILVLSNFVQGGGSSNILVLRVTAVTGGEVSFENLAAGATGANLVCNPGGVTAPADAACAATNGSVTPSLDPDFVPKALAPLGNYPVVGFFEGGLNLTALGLGGECFPSFLIETRSSPQINAVLKDFMLGSFQQCQAAIATEVHNATHDDITDRLVEAGTEIHDNAIVTGAIGVPTPTGDGVTTGVTFEFFTNGTCSGTPDSTQGPVALIEVTPPTPSTAGVAEAESTPSIPLPGSYSFRASYTGGGGFPAAGPSVCEPITVIEVPPMGSADVRVTKTGPAFAVAGDLVAYTITVTNAGPSDVQAVQLLDPVPDGLSFVSATEPCAGGVPCELGPLAAGASVTVTVTFQVSPAFAGPGLIVNTATAMSPTPDPDDANNVGSAFTVIEVPPMVSADADVQVTKTGSAAAVAGGLVAYTITVTNAGPSDAQAVQLLDMVPDGLSFVSATAPCAGGVPCELGLLAAGASVAVTVTFQVSPTFAGPGPIVNTAAAMSPTPDPELANNVGSASTVIEGPPAMGSADVSVTKTGPAEAPAGGSVAYTIAVTNLGPQPATAVRVADPTPPELAFVSNAGACVTAFPCDLGTLGVGETRTIVSTFTIAEPFTGPNPLVNTAVVSAAEADPAPANNTGSASTVVGGGPTADIEVLKILTMDGASVLAVSPGDLVTFWVKAENLGPSPATGVEVTDVLPPGLTFVSAVATQGSYEPGTGVWSVGDLAVGAMAILDITAVVTQAGPLVNTAQRSASRPPDPNPANDLSPATFDVAGAPPGLSVALNQPAFGPGQTLVLTATLRPGIAPALVDAYVVVELPDGSLLSLQLGGGLVPGIVPLARGFQPFPGTGELLHYRFTGGEPAGAYRVRTALTLAGTGMIFGSIEDTRFTVEP